MAAVPKSLGVLPPFVLQYDPSNAPVVQVAVSGGGLSGPQLYDYALNNIEPLLEGIPGVASASPNGGPAASDQRRRRPGQGAGARHHVRGRRGSGGAVERAPAVGRVHLAASSTPTSTRTPSRAGCSTIGDAVMKIATARPVLIRDVAPVEDGGAPETQAVSVNGTERRLSERPARARRQHARDRRRGEAEGRSTGLTNLPPGLQVDAGVRPVDVRAHHVQRAQARGGSSAGAHRPRHPALSAERARHADRVGRHPALVRHHADRPLRDGADAERLHPRGAHAGHGAPRRRRGRRAGVDPPPPADGADHLRRRAAREPTPSRCRSWPRRSRRWRCCCRCCSWPVWPRSSSRRWR